MHNKTFLALVCAISMAAGPVAAQPVMAAPAITQNKVQFTNNDYAILANIIGALESGGQVYGNRRYDAYAGAYANSHNEKTCTLGWAQFYGNEARLLVKLIFQTNESAAKAIDTNGKIQARLESDWVASAWNPDKDEKATLIALISSDVGKQCQDALFKEEMKEYISEASAYTNDKAAIMMYCQIRHVGGAGAAKRIFDRADNLTLDGIMASLALDKKDHSKSTQVGDSMYDGRNNKAYQFIKEHVNDVGVRGFHAGNTSATEEDTEEPEQEPADISELEIKGLEDKEYTGKPIMQNGLTVDGKDLVGGRDYSARYKNNKEIGVATITIEGMGNYTGTTTYEFNIIEPIQIDELAEGRLEDPDYKEPESITKTTVFTDKHDITYVIKAETRLVAGGSYAPQITVTVGGDELAGDQYDVVLGKSKEGENTGTITFKDAKESTSFQYVIAGEEVDEKAANANSRKLAAAKKVDASEEIEYQDEEAELNDLSNDQSLQWLNPSGSEQESTDYIAADVDNNIEYSFGYIRAQSACTWTGSKLNKTNGTITGPSGKETYYNMPMDGVIARMRRLGNNDPYWVRSDGVKMLGNYVMIASNLTVHPRGTIYETSLGMGIVCDTGGFAKNNPYQTDIAVTW